MENRQSYLSLARTILAAFEEQEKEIEALKQTVIVQQNYLTDLQSRLRKLEQQQQTADPSKPQETVKREEFNDTLERLLGRHQPVDIFRLAGLS